MLFQVVLSKERKQDQPGQHRKSFCSRAHDQAFRAMVTNLDLTLEHVMVNYLM